MSSNIPKLRFPEFKGEWQDDLIRNKFDFISTNSLSRDNLNYEEGAVKNIHYGDIHTLFRPLFDVTREKVPFVNTDRVSVRMESNNYLQKGDVIFVDASEDYNEIGKCIEVINTNNEKIIAGLHTIHARAKSKDEFYSGFVAHLMKIDSVHKQIRIIAQGVKVLSISQTSLGTVVLHYPNKDEQKKIANFLGAVDSRIEALEAMVELQKKYKQGIMQRIFDKTIRFKDDDGNPFPDWQEATIKNIGEVVTGGTPSKVENRYWGGDFVWVTAQDFKGKYIDNSMLKLTEIGRNKSRVIPRNSILVTCIASIGLNAINRVECSTNQQINAVICNNDNYSEFIYYAINYNTNRLKALAGQTAVPIISKSVFESFTITVPKSKREQEKIADFLSEIDAKIEATQKQLNVAREWKKGLLQKMFV